MFQNQRKYPLMMKDLLSFDGVSNINGSFSNTEIKEYKSKILVKAMEKAKVKAETLASVAGSKIIGVYAISDTGFQDLGARFVVGHGAGLYVDEFSDSFSEARPMMAKARKIEETIEIPKSIKISVQINAIFKIQ